MSTPAAAGAPSAPAGAPSAPAEGTQLVSIAAERKEAELRHQQLVRDETRHRGEIREMGMIAKENDEQLNALRTRVAAVTSELSQVKLRAHTEEAGDAAVAGELDGHQLTTFRDCSGAVHVAFQRIVKKRLADASFVERLTDVNAGSKPAFCHVLWEEVRRRAPAPRAGTARRPTRAGRPAPPDPAPPDARPRRSRPIGRCTTRATARR